MERRTSWHLSRMRPLAWVETLLKLAAFAVVFVAFAGGISDALLSFPPPMILPAIVTGLLLLGLVAGVYDRFLEKEIFAFVFIFLNILAHAAFVYLLLAGGGSLWFPGLMLAGDIVKLFEIRLYHMQVREFSPRVLYILTGVYVMGYGLILLLLYTPV